MRSPNLSFPGGVEESSIYVHSIGRPALNPLDKELLVTQEVKHTVELKSQKCNTHILEATLDTTSLHHSRVSAFGFLSKQYEP